MSTGNQAISFEVKSQLAKLLATENITMYHEPGAKTASFDTKNRTLVLPVWQNISEDLYDMLVVHEVGHALDTPSDKWVTAIADIAYNNHQTRDASNNVLMTIKAFLNVVEDARIDKLQKRRYPGSKRNYAIGYKELNDMNFFGLQNKDVNGLSFIDRANVYFKSTNIPIKFSTEERVLIRRMENTETFDDVVALTNELYALAKAKNTKKEDQSTPSDENDTEEGEDFEDIDDLEDGEGEDGEGEGEEGEDGEGEGEGEEGEDGEGEGEEGEDGEGEDGESGDDDVSAMTDDQSEAGGKSDDVVDTPITQEAYDKSLSKIVQDNDVNYVYLNVPKFNLEHIVDDFPVVLSDMEKEKPYWSKETAVQKFLDWRRAENDTISFMVKEFEMRKSADAYARIATAKTGVIDTNKLPSYKFTDDIFKKVTVIPKGKNHGFVMFLDWSGSMTYNLMNTMKQLFSLTMFCKRVNIPFEVYLFRTQYKTVNSKPQWESKNLGFQSDFKLRNVLSSRMNLNTLNKAYCLLWIVASRGGYYVCDKMDSTPLNQTILAADKIVNDFRIKNKLQIVNTIILTDGAADGCRFGVSALPYKKNGTKYILRDDVTKKTYWMEGNGYHSTSTFLRVLKDRTDCNLIGFFLHTGNLNGLVGYGIDDSVVHNDDVQKSWKENGFVGVQSAGYDEYYIIKSKNMFNMKDDVFQINTGMTKNKIASAFMKFSERKNTNRVMLSKFMARVSTNSF